jgi:tetratricopeptide (TPR) repeat protein
VTRRPWLAWLVVLGVLASFAGRAVAAPDPRELKAREDFVGGRYQDALDLFARLYAETLHPNYLRNIGRCYQNLGEADRAITTFRDYLRKAKALAPGERAEIEGYIKDMQELKRQQEALAPPAVAPAPPPPAAPVEPPTNAEALISTPAGTATETPASPGAGETRAFYQRWWFWAIVGGVVAAGVGGAAAAGAFSRTRDASCPSGDTCPLM